MKRRLLMLLSVFMTITSVGWMQAADGGPTITTDLTVAQKGRAIVFGITTTKGNAGDVTVRASLTADGNAFDTWESFYYESNSDNPGWIKWNSENDGFGPAGGFPLMDATSYIKVVPKEAGTFNYTLKVTKVDGNGDIITQACTLEVKDEPVSPVASIGDTDYASLATAFLFAEKDNTISLTAGDFVLSSQLVIDKPITLSGVAQSDGKPLTNLKADANANWPNDNKKVNLVSIEGSAEGNVILKNIRVQDSKASGINAQSKMTTNLVDVALEGNAKAGLLVHSKVVAENLVTISNGWGGVNVATDGTPVYSPKLTFSPGCSFAEQSKIWSEDTKTDPAQLVEGPDGWTSYVGVQGASAEEMRYWTNSKLTVETQISDQQTYYNVFANGNPVTIKGADQTGNVVIWVSDQDFVQLPSDQVYVYGGSKDAPVASTSITMESGSVARIYGGGYGSTAQKAANVNGMATIQIKGGKITTVLCGGGNQFAKTNAVDINISGNGTKVQCIYAGGFAHPAQKTPVAVWNDAVCGTKDVKITITEGVELPEGLGCGGGQGYTYTGTSKVTITGAKLGNFYGTLANGYADEIEATLKNCVFSKVESLNYYEMGAINRGQIRKGTFTFDGCTFNDLNQLKASLGAVDGWADSDTNGKPVPTVSEKVIFKFVNSKSENPVMMVGQGLANANIELTGAKASLKKFRDGTVVPEGTSDFAIASGKTWSFSSGLELGTGEDAATLDNKGKLELPASDIMTGINLCGGSLMADSATVTADSVIVAMNKATSKSDLSSKTFSIECKDGVIASNKEVAKELLKAGKVVMVLSFADGTYSIASFQKTLAKITNLPDSVVYGTAPIKLAFNYGFAEAKISGTDNGVVKIEKGILTFLKPGDVKIEITPDTNADGKIDENDDSDVKYIQDLKVTKRTLTLAAGIVPNYGDDSKGDSIVYNAKTDITLKWVADNIKVSGLPWEVAASTYFNTNTAPTGTRANKNVGDKVPVTVNEITVKDSSDYYTLAPITFVTAKVVKAKATVTANDVENYKFGSDLPAFTATTTDLITEGGVADKLDGTLKFICSATPDSLVKDGGYDIMPYGQTSDNYAITFVAGKLTVNAVNPKIEIVDAKVTGDADSKTIKVRANLVHSGGATNDATVTAATTTKANGAIEKGDDGYYTCTVSGATAATHTVTFTATAGDKSGTASIDVIVEKGTPQNLAFDSKVLSSVVYGDSLLLSATSDATAATGKYTYTAKVGDSEAKIISANNVLKPTKAGDIIVTVTRAADDKYSSATVTKTIQVTPRPLKANVAAFAPKVYDGKVDATVPAITLSGVIGNDKVNIKTGATATYASKNVGTHDITLSTLTLDGEQATNYTLIQPSGLKGEITKKAAIVKVDDVTRMYNQRYTKYTFTAPDLVDGESLASVYTGKLDVTENEKDGVLVLTIDPKLCQNYDLKAQNGTLTITKGNPVVVAYIGADDKPAYLVVDSAGNQNMTVSSEPVDGYFQVTKDDKEVITSVNSIPQSTKAFKSLATKAAADWDGWNSDKATLIEYNATGSISNADGYTYSSTDLNRLAVADNGSLTANGVGKVAIIATSTSGDVKVKLYEVTPKMVTYKADMSKTYDGLTQATGTVTLDGVQGSDNVVLDMEGVTFNYTSKNAGTEAINPSQAPILVGSDANNYNLNSGVTGKISKKNISVSDPISTYYTGSTSVTLKDFNAEGILSNDIVSLNVTLDDATVGTHKFTLNSLSGTDAANYTLSKANSPMDGTVLKPTIIVDVPETAPSESEVKNRMTYTIRETGYEVSKAIFGKNVKVVSLGNNVYQVSTEKEDPNYSLVYTKNLIGYKSEGGNTPSGGDVDETVTISLDATTKVLPRLEEFVLKATVSPSGKTVTWSSSDPTVASVTADGNKATVKGLKVGTATITAKIGDVTATCEVTVDFATGLEEALANTEVFGRKGNIYVNPLQPLQVTVVNMIGKIVYNARISGNTQIPVTKGIYIVKLTNAGNTNVTKVSVY